MSGLVGKKIGMTSVFDGQGRSIPVTVVEVPASVITQIKTEETDGYNAIQLSSFDRKAKNVSKSVKGHFDKAGSETKAVVKEFRNFLPEGLDVGDELKAEDVFQVGDIIDVAGTSKGRGFAGVIKRHNFSGVGDETHGQHNRLRAPGSIGGASDPARVFKGMKMGGQYGNSRVKVKNLSVAKIIAESNLVLITGSIPGPNGGYVELLSKPSAY
ncbi:MAG TPA: 50S ribosomal protein L3 [Balneola sp.]|jgi:large subunit ribosomal protein L3|nr:50S ribosomal protein L3 [Balneola sp.]MBF64929.1 50S ribosomal protein L3 [Balneola sp.]HAH51965.1 50S ribosomal protein L3 [Balneola sp.]|tara:strand:- start:13817 stop:14455 length:639 start_codon:yes stop_codon:yes gene_type:complete